MSYILDAIKKSEAERGHGSIPSLQTVHSSSLSYKTDNKQIWPYILIGLLLSNIAGLVYYFANTNNTENAQTSVFTAATEQQDSTTKAIIRPVPTIETKIETQSVNIAQQEPRQIPAINEVLNVEDLPSHIKQRIPTLDFTGHVYSSSPILRSIIINGSFKEEGDAINHEFTLSEITPRGAIFEYQGTLFEVSIITGWN